MKLTPDQDKWLKWLIERGGCGILDRYGRVHAMGENSPNGSQVSWLYLFVKGAVVAHEGRIQVASAWMPKERAA